MRIKKLLGKGIGASWTPLFTEANLTNRKKKVDIDLRISKSKLLGKSRGCRLTILDAKNHRNLYEIKISRKEAYRLMQSKIMYKSWRIPKGGKK